MCLVAPQIFYKDDLNWLKGIGCYAWDTPEIVRSKNAMQLQSDVSPLTPPNLFYFYYCLSFYVLTAHMMWICVNFPLSSLSFRICTEPREFSTLRITLWCWRLQCMRHAS